MQKFKIAAVQEMPVFMDREATVEKACALIAKTARNGTRLVVFPETFIPTYPEWTYWVPLKEYDMLTDVYAELLEQAVTIPGDAVNRLCQAAREAGVYVVMGINERDNEASKASLYNSLLFIDAEGNLMGKHRKMVPTMTERTVWARGDGTTLNVYDTPLGNIGGLICWENYMPLARYALYAQGVQIYLAPTRDPGDTWLATLRHIAREGGAFVIGCNSGIRVTDIPDRFEFKKCCTKQAEWLNEGNSAIVNPHGQFIAGPLDSEEGVLYADVDLSETRKSKMSLDVAGHYARPDVFQFSVQAKSYSMISFEAPATLAKEETEQEKRL